MKISSLSIKELLYLVDISVKAALSVSDLKNRLKNHSFTKERMEHGLTLAENVKVWQNRQKTTQAQARQTQRTFEDVRRSVQALYAAHREAARFAYRKDIHHQELLQLKGSPSRRYAEWRSEMDNFYTYADAKSLEKFGVLAAEVIEVQSLLKNLSELEIMRNDARRQAQQVTEGKKAVVKELRQWFGLFIRTARLACTDDPQLLEAMGIVVPS